MASSFGDLYGTVTVDNKQAVASLQQVSTSSKATSQTMQGVSGSSEQVSKSFEHVEISHRMMRQGFNAMIALGAIFSTAIIASMTALASSTEDGKNAVNEFKDSLGVTKAALADALTPTFKELVNAITPFILAFASWVRQNPEAVQQFVTTSLAIGGLVLIVGLAGKTALEFSHIIELTSAIVQYLGASSLLASLPLLALAAALAVVLGPAIMKDIDNMTKQFKNFSLGSVAALGNVNDAASATAQKIKDIQQQIQDENDNFNRQLSEIVAKRRQDLNDNKVLLAEEEKAYKDKQDQMAKDYKTKSDDMKKQNETRLKDLEASMNATLVAGSATYNKDKEHFEQAIADEVVAGQQKQQDLADQYSKDEQAAADEYDKKTADLQKKITADEEMLQKHYDEIQNMVEVQADDEIDTLNKTHQKRLDSLTKELEKEKTASSAAFDAIGKAYSDMEKSLPAFNIDFSNTQTAAQNAATNIGSFFLNLGKSIADTFIDVAAWIAKSIRQMIPDVIANAVGINSLKGIDQLSATLKAGVDKGITMGIWDFNTPSAATVGGAVGHIVGNVVKNLPHGAGGLTNFRGGMAVVGENGPELVNLPSGSSVLPNGRSGSTINNYNNFNYTEDLNVFNAKLAYQLKTI